MTVNVINSAVGLNVSSPSPLQVPMWTGTAWTTRATSGLINSTTPEAYGATGNDSSHDDAPAIEAAIAAMVAACIADGSYVCEVVFSSGKNYYANRAPVDNPTINGLPTYANAQIALPYLGWDWAAPNAKKLVTLILRSQASAQASNTSFNQQPCSIITTPTSASGGNGLRSVIGGPAWHTTNTPPNQWSGINLVVDGVNIISPPNPALAGLDMTYINTCDINSMHVYVPTNGYAPPTAATNVQAFGVRFPNNQNGGNIRVGTLGVYGYYTAMNMPEHLRADNLMFYWNRLVFSYDSHADHESHIKYLQTSGNATLVGFLNINTGTEDVPGTNWPPLIVDLWGMEDIASQIRDPSNGVFIRANVFYVGLTTQRVPTLVGASNVQFKSIAQPTGALTASTDPARPAVPATTVAYRNLFGHDAWVTVTGGTVTVIAVDGVATGLTSGQILVPNGKSITLTYSSAPTWNWWLF